MPKCYLLTLTSGSSLDQYSNNVTLFNLVEQINLPPHAEPPPGALLPLEIHAYFQLLPHEMNLSFEIRFVLVSSSSGLETPTQAFTHKSTTPRYRTRAFGLPVPPLSDQFELRVDFRIEGHQSWTRDNATWPLTMVEASPREVVTH
ncbi:MAG TPA: hypothetical protein VI072_05195 [Polyangiaceae bacterium]